MNDQLDHDIRLVGMSPADQPRTIATISVLFAVAALVYSLLPVFLGSAADSLRLTHQQIGYAGSAYLMGFAGAPILMPLWAQKVDWRRILMLALAVSAGSFAAAASSTSYTAVIGLLTLGGVGTGVVYSISTIGLGKATRTEHAFMVGQTVSMFLAAVLVWTLPTLVIPRYGFAGVLLVFAVVMIAAISLTPWLPRLSTTDRPTTTKNGRCGAALPAVIAMTGFGFFYVGLIGLWSFLERIGHEKALDAQLVGQAFALEKVLVLLACVLIFVQGGRLGHRLPLIIGCVGLVASILLLGLASSAAAYLMAVGAFGIFWTYSYPFQMSAIFETDRQGRYAGAIPTFMGVGSTLGPTVAGYTVIGNNYTPVYISMGLFCIIGTILLLVAGRFVHKPQPSTKF
jgi:MFS family permease